MMQPLNITIHNVEHFHIGGSECFPAASSPAREQANQFLRGLIRPEPVSDLCITHAGTAARPFHACRACHGERRVIVNHSGEVGDFTMEDCPACGGTGRAG